MIRFLDFDRTLFDTDAYLASLPDEPACAPFREELLQTLASKREESVSGGEARIAVWDKVSEAIRSGALSFAPGYLSRFLYADTLETLRAYGNEAIIVSYGEKERQRVKIESALAGVVRLTVLYTGMESKAEFLSKWPGYYGASAVLVDDRPSELEALASALPALSLYEMRRDNGKGDGRWPVIHTLADLP
ncbi:MAG: hypothetical protein KBC38_01560 [Candidatus Pacebacteria bacterium]|nr:hypothetical protein [Candidatus Paceibacterota bacterium]MBP9840729.1 hypothetical protein [Candidatus Paceibacterota bacterium]